MGLVVGYARVSTDKQALTHSLEHQKARLHDSGIDILYYDVESGGEPSRKGFDEVLALIKEKSVTKVVATKWDRITRNLQLYLEIQDAVKRYNVKLHFLDGGEADFDTPTGRLRSVIEVAFAAHEREKIVERVNDGIKNSAASGRSMNSHFFQPSYAPRGGESTPDEIEGTEKKGSCLD